MSAIVPANSTEDSSAEANIVAREMVAAFGRQVKWYRDYYELSPEEARQRAAALSAPEFNDYVKNLPPNEVTWFDLDHIGKQDPTLALQRWEDIKQAALDELRTGHRAAIALEPSGSRCWERAQFAALRTEFAHEWQPRNGIERQLIDMMAQAQANHLLWMERLATRSATPSRDVSKEESEKGPWVAPRVRDAEAIDQAAGMVDRFNRIFLRTLRALRDLRRYSHQVIVQNAGQVNIGDKQVNVVES